MCPVKEPHSGHPNRAPVMRFARFPEPPFHYLSMFSVIGTHPTPPKFPPTRHPCPEPSSTHPLIICLSLKVHHKNLLYVPPTSVTIEREMLRLQSQLFIYSFWISEFPKRTLKRKGGKSILRPQCPRQTEGIHTIGCVLFLHRCHCPSAMHLQHVFFHLGLGIPEPN
jgi:hypothetical protein